MVEIRLALRYFEFKSQTGTVYRPAMTQISTKPPSGMRDFLPEELARRRYVIDLVRKIYEQYGFQPIETPSIENLSTLLGSTERKGTSCSTESFTGEMLSGAPWSKTRYRRPTLQILASDTT